MTRTHLTYLQMQVSNSYLCVMYVLGLAPRKGGYGVTLLCTWYLPQQRSVLSSHIIAHMWAPPFWIYHSHAVFMLLLYVVIAHMSVPQFCFSRINAVFIFTYYRSHVGAAMLNLPYQSSAYVVAMWFIAHPVGAAILHVPWQHSVYDVEILSLNAVGAAIFSQSSPWPLDHDHNHTDKPWDMPASYIENILLMSLCQKLGLV